MRGYRSIAAAAALVIAGTVASFAPAQAAATRAAPAVTVEAENSGVQLVHRRYRQDGRYYRRYSRRGHYPRYYGHRRYYQPYAYYGYPRYYRRPGVTFQFSFGGGHGYHY